MTSAVTLYAIEEERAALLDTIDLVEDEQQKLAIVADIAEANEAAVQKRCSVIAFRANKLAEAAQAKAQAEILKAEAKRLEEYACGIEARIDHLDEYLLRVVLQFAPEPKRGPKKLECALGVIKAVRNPDKLEITDEHQVPSRFKEVTVTMPADTWLALPPEAPQVTEATKVQYKVQAQRVKEALLEGQDIPGADVQTNRYRLEVK